MTTRAQTRRRRLAASLIVLAAGCTGSDAASLIDDGETSTDAEPAADVDDASSVTLPPATTVPRIPNAASAELLRQDRLYSLPDRLGSLQLEHGVAPVQIGPGQHVSDALGIETTLRLDRWWRLEQEEVGSFWLTRPDAAVGDLLPAVVFLRPVGLAPPSRVAEPDFMTGEHSVSPDDLGEWLEAVPQLAVLDSGAITVGDRVGEWFDVDVVDDAGPLLDDCSPEDCIYTWWSGGSRSTVARNGESLRYYSFPDPAGPIYVLVAAADDEFDEWNRLTTELLLASEFGASAPHPVEPGTSAGAMRIHDVGSTWRFTMFPGITVTAERLSISTQAPGLLEFQPFRGGRPGMQVGLIRPFATFVGEPLNGISDVVSALTDAGLQPITDTASIDYSVAVFDGAVDGPIFRRAEIRPQDDPRFVGWPEFEPSYVRIWVLDTPVGPLLLAAAVDGEDQFDFAIPQAESLGRSIGFD